jgi:hypothetical protein
MGVTARAGHTTECHLHMGWYCARCDSDDEGDDAISLCVPSNLIWAELAMPSVALLVPMLCCKVVLHACLYAQGPVLQKTNLQFLSVLSQ